MAQKSTRRAVKPVTKVSTAKKESSAKLEDDNKDLDNDDESPWYTVYTKGDKEYNTYMSTEWGFEKRGDVPLFEKLCLEGAQSGLSWLTILRKREAYRTAFHNFNIQRVSQMTSEDIDNILNSDGSTTNDPKRDIVVRHRGKLEAIVNNAKCILEMYDSQSKNKTKKSNINDYGVFDEFVWSFVDNKPILNMRWKKADGLSGAPSKSDESLAMSNALKKLGFKFVGPMTCYSLMQSCGLVIDHPIDSPEWQNSYLFLQSRPGSYQKGPPLPCASNANNKTDQKRKREGGQKKNQQKKKRSK